MATTARQLIDDALRILQVRSPDIAPTDAEYTEALTVLNSMLGEWANQEELTPVQYFDVDPLTPGVTTYSVGVNGAIRTTFTPIKITTAQITEKGKAHPPLEIVESVDRFWALFARIKTGTPKFLYYQDNGANGTIEVGPPPLSGQSLKIAALVQQYSFSTLDGSLELSPGWDFAISSDLAVHLAPRYQLPLSESMVTRAKDAKTAIARTAMSRNKQT